MRITALLRGDARFQFKYGIHFLYLVFTMLYIGVLFALPEGWREQAALVMIFTDPAAMGLFFMGGIILFEKSERVMDSLAVSPVKAWEYVISKLVSIGATSTVVGLAIGLSAGIVRNPPAFILGVFLCSCLFSSVALILAKQIHSLNQFMIMTVPAELFIVLPALLWLFWFPNNWLLLHPGVSMMVLCLGQGQVLTAGIILLIWTLFFAVLACRSTKRMIQSVGGVHL